MVLIYWNTLTKSATMTKLHTIGPEKHIKHASTLARIRQNLQRKSYWKMLRDKRQVCVFAYLRSGQITSSPLVLWSEESHQGWIPIHPFLLPLPGVLTEDLWWSHQTPVFHDWQSQQAGKEAHKQHNQENGIKERWQKRGGAKKGSYGYGLCRIEFNMFIMA